MPLVSVIIPSYNRPEFLEKISIPSIIKQTYKNWELIVVDDGSTEDIKSVVERFQKDHPDKSISYIRQENKGQGGARNTGIKSAKGEWVLLLDSDDALLPGAIEILVGQTHKTPKMEIIVARCWDCDFESRKVRGWGIVNPSSILFKKALFEELGFYSEDRALIGVEDIELQFNWKGQREVPEIHLMTPVALYMRHGNQVTRPEKVKKLKAGVMKIIESYSKYPVPKNLLGLKLFEVANFLIVSGETKKGREYLKSSLQIAPRKDVKISLLVSYFGSLFYRFYVGLAKLALDMRRQMFFYKSQKEFGKSLIEARQILKSLSGLKRRILVVATDWLSNLGGGRKVVEEILNFLAQNPATEFVFLSCEIKVPLSEDPGLTSKIQFISLDFSGFWNPLKTIKMFSRFGKLIRDKKPDVIMDISGPSLKVINLLFVRLYRVPGKYIFFDHTPPTTLANVSRFKFIHSWFMPFMYRKADQFVTVSRELMEFTSQIFKLDPSKIGFIYNPIDSKVIEKKASEILGREIEKSIKGSLIVGAGRFDPLQKDFPTLLRAFALVSNKTESSLLILGTGDQEGELRNLVRDLGIADKVIFAGYQENPYKFFRRADIFVLATKFESFGMVLVEAMACGTPVVVSDCDFGPREILERGRSGRLVPVGDSAALADAILYLLENPEERQKLSELGRRRVMIFEFSKIVEQYRSMFGIEN